MRLVNLSIESGKFPTLFKIARVIPIFKSGNRQEKNNYRPISLLHPISKIFEKIMHSQLMSYLKRFNLLKSNQFGFQKNISTSHAIVENLQYVYDCLDSGYSVSSFFLDFSKAFDCVDHGILLAKLYAYGIRGFVYNWFKSYLSNRKQYVNINNSNSCIRILTHGVPQGSVLGPLLFLIFINDFPSCNSFFKFTLFADDSTLTCKYKPCPQLPSNIFLQNQLDTVYSWLKANKIKVNSNKCSHIVFSYRNNSRIPPITFGNGQISQSSSTRFLGILIDEKLQFSNHIQSIASKISKSIGILNKLKLIFPSNILLKLYLTLIHPHLTYAIETWFSSPACFTNKLFTLQKKAIRIILGLPNNSHTTQHFKSLKVLKLKDLYILKLCCMVFSSLNSSQNNLSLMLQAQYRHHTHNTRSGGELTLPRYRRTSSQSSFLFQSIKVYNSLPLNLRNCISITSFKINVKKYLLEAY